MKPGIVKRCIYSNKEARVMASFIESSVNYRPLTPNRSYQSDLKIAVQCALAAGLCLGLPTGVFFWLIIVQRWMSSHLINTLAKFFQDYLVPPVLLEMLGAFGWGLL